MTEETFAKSEVMTPKIFISYSWSNDDYIIWVRQLAEELAENNIDVELDQWSLREGDDKYVYMERMVTDPDIQKVVILCDKKYQEKADGRDGGVGTETTIMTPEIYRDVKAKAGEQKFIPVVTERDQATKKEFMPVFLAGRKYIDLTDQDHYAEKFEQLVRTIHNKPLLTKPKPGSMPGYLLEDERVNLATSARFRRAIEQVKNDKPQALNAVKDYFSVFSENLKEYDIISKEITPNQIVERIKEMIPARDEAVDLIEAIARYSSETRMYEEVHAFFEDLILYLEPRNTNGSYHTWSSEHYKFFVHELFLYAVASLLKYRRFEEINELIGQGYYRPGSRFSGERSGLTTFCVFDTYSEALDYYNRSLPRQFHTIYGHLLSERATRSDVRFDDLVQADLFLYLREKLESKSDTRWQLSWYPDTLLHMRRRDGALEIFSRSESKRFFSKMQTALGGATKEQIEQLINELKEKKRDHLGSDFNSMSIGELCGIERIATRP